MPRLGYDGITPASVPAGAAVYLGYVNGTWPSFAAIKAQHPRKLYISISVNASGRAMCLDVENGDATPQQAPGWVTAERAAGNANPIVYMNQSTWAVVKAEFVAQNVAMPLFWVASYVTDPSKAPAIPAGAIGVQYYDYGGYDVSVLADYIPGVDPTPDPPAPTQEDDVAGWCILEAPVAENSTVKAMFHYTGGALVHIPGEPTDPEGSYGALSKQYPTIPVDWQYFANVIKTVGANYVPASATT